MLWSNNSFVIDRTLTCLNAQSAQQSVHIQHYELFRFFIYVVIRVEISSQLRLSRQFLSKYKYF